MALRIIKIQAASCSNITPCMQQLNVRNLRVWAFCQHSLIGIRVYPTREATPAVQSTLQDDSSGNLQAPNLPILHRLCDGSLNGGGEEDSQVWNIKLLKLSIYSCLLEGRWKIAWLRASISSLRSRLCELFRCSVAVRYSLESKSH